MEYEVLSTERVDKLKNDTDFAREYLTDFYEFRLFQNYINTRLAGDFACNLAVIIADYRRQVMQLQSQVNELQPKQD